MDRLFLCFVDFEPGDLAWAKVKGYNWWPSLVCIDPEEKVYIKTAKGKTQCHVQFFDERRSSAWVHAKLVYCMPILSVLYLFSVYTNL